MGRRKPGCRDRSGNGGRHGQEAPGQIRHPGSSSSLTLGSPCVATKDMIDATLDRLPSARSSRNGIPSCVLLCCFDSDRKCITSVQAARVASNGRCCTRRLYSSVSPCTRMKIWSETDVFAQEAPHQFCCPGIILLILCNYCVLAKHRCTTQLAKLSFNHSIGRTHS